MDWASNQAFDLQLFQKGSLRLTGKKDLRIRRYLLSLETYQPAKSLPYLEDIDAFEMGEANSASNSRLVIWRLPGIGMPPLLGEKDE